MLCFLYMCVCDKGRLRSRYLSTYHINNCGSAHRCIKDTHTSRHASTSSKAHTKQNKSNCIHTHWERGGGKEREWETNTHGNTHTLSNVQMINKINFNKNLTELRVFFSLQMKMNTKKSNKIKRIKIKNGERKKKKIKIVVCIQTKWTHDRTNISSANRLSSKLCFLSRFMMWTFFAKKHNNNNEKSKKYGTKINKMGKRKKKRKHTYIHET